MKKSYTDEEVTNIENSAYETGLSIGKHVERTKIIEALRELIMYTWEDLEIIKGRLATRELGEEDREDLENDRVTTFMYLSGLNGALKAVEQTANK